MIMTERTASAVWSGTLTEGSGNFTVGSGAFPTQNVNWARRSGDANGGTSPEELIAAAHATCYAMAFSNALAENGTPAQQLDVTCTVGFGPKDGGGVEVKYSKLSVTGQVEGVTAEQFQELSKAGEAGCPISNAIRGNVPIELEAKLA